MQTISPTDPAAGGYEAEPDAFWSPFEEITEDRVLLEERVVGAMYEVKARNFSVAIWTGSDFVGPREKLGSSYLDHEYPWEQGPPFGTAYAVRRIGERTYSYPEGDGRLLALLEAAQEIMCQRKRLEVEVGVTFDYWVKWNGLEPYFEPLNTAERFRERRIAWTSFVMLVLVQWHGWKTDGHTAWKGSR